MRYIYKYIESSVLRLYSRACAIDGSLYFILQKVAATYALRLAACPATWATRATVPVSTTASSKETRGRPNDNAAIAARCGAITRRRACAIRAIPDAHSPHRQALQVAYACFGPEISPSATFQITNYVGYG